MNERPLKPAHASGKKFVLGIGIVFAVMAIGLWFGLKAFVEHARAAKPPEIALRWNDRDRWPTSPATPFDLEYDSVVQAETGKQYRKAEFALSKDAAEEKRIETVLLDCAMLARDAHAFAQDETRATLEAHAAALPAQFYPAYLLAVWHAAHGNRDQAQTWMARAVAAAPAILLEDGHAPGETLPALAVSFDRLKSMPKAQLTALDHAAHHLKEQILNRDLVLVYPAPQADEKGRVWLPVFRDMYRWADPAKPGPQADNRWFSMPDGARVGKLNGPGANVPPRP